MNSTKIVIRDEINVIGISTRTTNEQELSGNGKIAKLWEQYVHEQVAEKIPNRLHPGVTLAVYTNYENGIFGSYSLVIGEEVDPMDDIPDSMVSIKLPASTYAVFTSSKGPISKVVPEMWGTIWRWSRADGKRTFAGDFERYDERSMDPNHAEVDIYISVTK
jgi:predicted transcriptional regulator YdeE